MSLAEFSHFEHAGWERAAACYEASFAGATRLFGEALLEAARVAPGTRLLDLACGTGWLAGLAAARGATPIGADFSRSMLAEARRAHPTIELHEADARDLPFPAAEFDAVAMSFGIHHLDRPDAAIGEAFRVLRPGGVFAFTLWVRPQENPAWAIVQGAARTHGDPNVAMPAGNDAAVRLEKLLDDARRAGFAGVSHRMVERTWSLPAGADLVDIFATGTVRMASLLRGQTAEALERIRERVREDVAAYTRDGATALPIRAVLVGATKP